MKKLTALCLTIALILSLLPTAFAAGDQVVVLRLGYNQMSVNGTVQQVDEGNAAIVPLLEEARTLVPVSRIVAAFGGESGWDGDTLSATFSLNGHKVAAQIGSKLIKVDGRSVTMDIPARLIQARTYVPLRAVLEGLGLIVNYEPKYQLILVSEKEINMDRYLTVKGVTGLLMATGAMSSLIAESIETPSVVSSDYDTSSKAGVWIPDLTTATGGVFHSKTELNADGTNMDSFLNDYPRSADEAVDVIKEYYEAVAALPYFEVIEALELKWDFYHCSFRYTGTGSVKKSTVKSLYGDYCDLDVYLQKGKRNISVNYAKGLQIVDTGLRLSICSEGDANFQAVGTYLTDAYQYQNGVYSNLSDGKLSAKSGECAMLVNGKSVKATVEFTTNYPNETWAADQFTLSGFDRTNRIAFAFPKDYAQTWDVYMADTFVRQSAYPYGITDKAHQWGFGASSDNGNNWVMPLDNSKNVFQGCNVRVLQWDKSGDTVVYFAVKLTLDGKSYEVEGLLAARNKVSSTQSSSGGSSDDWGGSGSGSFRKDCSICHGTGDCQTCGGDGYLWSSASGKEDRNCWRCNNTGRCTYCDGTGKQ